MTNLSCLNEETLYKMHQAALEFEKAGELEQAVAAYLQILEIEPNRQETNRSLFELYKDMGEETKAQEIAHKLIELGDETARSFLAKPIDTDKTDDISKNLPAVPCDADLFLFAELFNGREGVHSRQWKSRDGRCGYSPVYQQLTPGIVHQHLLGSTTIGVYVVKKNNTCAFAALDIDAKFTDNCNTEELLKNALKTTLSLALNLEQFGVEPLIEDSGAKGYHLWIFFEEPWPAWKARKLFRGVAANVDCPDNISVEVFPAQAQVEKNGLGNLIKLPLGLHLKSDRFSKLLDRDGRILSDPYGRLRRQKRTSLENLEQMLTTVSANESMDEAEINSTGIISVQDEENRTDIVRPQLNPLDEYRLDEDGELLFLMSKCRPLKDIVDTAMRGQLLTSNEIAVVTYTAGHLPMGNKAVNHLLNLTGQNQNPLRSRLRGHPTGCSKIRSRLGIMTGEKECDCEFDETLGEYAHPLLHLALFKALKKNKAESIAHTEANVDAIRQELSQLEKLLENAQNRATELKAILAQSIAANDMTSEIKGPAKVEPQAVMLNVVAKE